MCNEKNIFSHYRTVNTVELVRAVNGSTMNAFGEGDAKLIIMFKKNDKVIQKYCIAQSIYYMYHYRH